MIIDETVVVFVKDVQCINVLKRKFKLYFIL